MFKLNHSITTAVVTIILGLQVDTDAIAGSPSHVAMATKNMKEYSQSQLDEKQRVEWGWWVRKDWETYSHNGLSFKAKKMLVKAAQYGNAEAQYVLGMLYIDRDNEDRAIHWLEKATKQGHNRANFAYSYVLNSNTNFTLGC